MPWIADPSFSSSSSNSPDTYAHVFGPDSDEAIESYRAVDEILGDIGSAVRWSDDLVLVTSDHDQETIDPASRVDLRALAEAAGADATVVEEGSAAMLVGPGADDLSWLRGIPGVEGWVLAAPGVTFVLSSPGWWFADGGFPDLRGAHGGYRTRQTVAIAAGPRGKLDMLRETFQEQKFRAEDWYTVVQSVRAQAWTDPPS